jgi:two-component system, NarL family, invasion response regulator UvrY
VRVLIVDDHPVVVSGCKTLLAAEPAIEVVDAAEGKAGMLLISPIAPMSP